MKTKLSEVANIKLGKMLDAEKNKGDLQPYIGNINVRWGEFDLESVSLMRFEENEQERYRLQYGDLIVCEGGEPGRCAIWENQLPGMKYQKALHRVRGNERVLNNRFLMYWLYLTYHSGKLKRYFTGSTIHHLPTEALSNIEIDLPSIETQNSIARFCENIDRKIALNNTINAELEKAAKLLYDYWFVQFDFPGANEKPYRASGGSMEYNEQLKREIPKGWRVEALGEMLDVSRGSIITEKDTAPGEVKVVAAGITHSYFHAESNRPKNTITVSSSGANAGYLNFWQEEIYASDCITVRAKSDVETLLAYHFLKSMQTILFRKATGSAQPHVYPHDIAGLQMPEIPANLIEKIRELFIGINNQIGKNKIQNKELTALRDFLLPLLMNGQVTVATKDNE